LTEEPTNLTVDIRRLEEKVDNLRWAVILLFIIVSLLSIYVVFQLTPQPIPVFFLAAGLIIIVCILLLFRACTENESGAPAGT
jgi:hypothetical protein